jgi:thiol-disulfide isomerase/thioredoxin
MQKNMFSIMVLLLVTTLSCSSIDKPKGNFTVSGTIKNFSGTLMLNEITSRGLVLLDSVLVDANGGFSFTNKSVSQATFAMINFNTGAVVLVLDSGMKITVSIDAKSPDVYGISGSDDNEEMRKLILVNNQYMRMVNELEKKYNLASNADISPEQQMQIRAEYDLIMQKRELELRQTAQKMSFGIMPYFVTNFLLPDSDFDFLESIDKRLYSQYASSKYAQELHVRVNKLRSTAVGQVVSDIVMQDPYGKTIALSSLRGKYVLVDFWASWCGPCRRENPNVVKLFNKYKDKGFDIYSVSLDDNKDAWMRAINSDQLLWASHVSDLKKWGSSVVPQFNIEGIPYTMLLDADGRIIAKNLRGEQLEAKLKEIFNF